jgi:DNA-binding Lrp family transcriptional regulator
MAQLRVDDVDLALLSMLREDAWLSFKELATGVNLSPSAVHDRVTRLKDQGVLRGAHADVNMKALGFALDVLTMVELAEHGSAAVADLIDELSAVAEVQAVFFLSGQTDLVVRIAARDTDALRSILEKIASRSDVGQLRTALVYESRFSYGVRQLAED